MPRLQQLFGPFIDSTDQMRIGLDHHHIIAGRLSADHAVHGQKPGGLVNRKLSIGPRFHMKMSGPGTFFVENKQVTRRCRVLVREMWLIVSADNLHVHPFV